jgi:hypothetical protein
MDAKRLRVFCDSPISFGLLNDYLCLSIPIDFSACLYRRLVDIILFSHLMV